jgi:tetratricopeptide (TPR) repeat protein
VTRELTASRDLAEACLTSLDAAQARRALILLARASADHESARTLLESSLARFPDVIADLTAPREVMIGVADAIPYPSLALAPAHASISGRILGTYEFGTADRALWLNNLTVLLGDLGRWEEALAAIEEAVTIRRELAQARSNAILPDLAASLSSQSVLLGNLGRWEEALAAIEEAVTIRRELAQARPDAILPELAGSLSNQSVFLGDLGRRDEALAAIEEAVTIRRELVAGRPDAFLPDLAASLSNQSIRLADLGRP